VDDIAGVAVIAVVYSSGISPEYLAIAALLFVFCLLLNRRGVLRLSVYVPLGIALWWAMYRSGVHPTLAGILLALAIPSRPTDISDSEAETVEDQEPAAALQESVADRLESALHPWVSFGIVPLFALVNADISLQGLRGDAIQQPIFLGLVLGLVLGKPIGITLFSWLAVRLRFAELSRGVTWKQLHAASWLGGIGFTVSIFIAGLAFHTEQQYTLARAAVLAASVCAAGIAACLIAVTCKRQQNPT
jgi:NhaA family Na+:H+ antiporter